jgi:hypothetical protein
MAQECSIGTPIVETALSGEEDPPNVGILVKAFGLLPFPDALSPPSLANVLIVWRRLLLGTWVTVRLAFCRCLLHVQVTLLLRLFFLQFELGFVHSLLSAHGFDVCSSDEAIEIIPVV